MMPSNRLSEIFGITTFGESHGPAIGLVIDSPLPGKDFPSPELHEMLLRRSHKGIASTSRREADRIEVLSGVFDGKTTGMPLCIIVRNTDARPADYDSLKDIFRPGHADFSWFSKYGIHDYRGGGRSSGRETLARVIAADHVQTLLKDIKVLVQSLSIGQMQSAQADSEPNNPFHWPNPKSYRALLEYLQTVKDSKDSVGGILRIRVTGVPAGLGDPIYEKLSANIARAMFSIGSVRGILFGDGLSLASSLGSEVNDQFTHDGFQSNHHGGILGGVSTGAEIRFDLVIRPISSIGKSQTARDKDGNVRQIQIQGRHDSCHIPRIIPVVETMIKLCLADAIQHQRLIDQSRQDLAGFRESLDKLDEELLILLKRRLEIVQQVKSHKAEKQLPFKDPAREEEILSQGDTLARELGIDPELAVQILRLSLQLCDT